jgi:hypothetical protein
MSARTVVSTVSVTGRAPVTGVWTVRHPRGADPLEVWAQDVGQSTSWQPERVRRSEHGYVYALRSRHGKRSIRFHVAVETTLTRVSL